MLALGSCDPPTTKWDIRGSWYVVDYNRGGHHDATRYYSELHVGDSTIEVFDEITGRPAAQSYYITKDSVYKCFWTGPDCEFIPLYKIRRLERDTLWMAVDPEWSRRNSSGGIPISKPQTETFWVRLPKGEKGYFDHVWTPETRDSLEWAVFIDYDRRATKCFSSSEEYDSTLKTGRWNWTMKDAKAAEELNKIEQTRKQ